MFSDTHWLIWAIGIITVLAVVSTLSRTTHRIPAVIRKRFLTENEARVLKLLETALPNHRVMAQVAMGALLKPKGGGGKSTQATRNRFAQKIVDFVVVTRDTAEVVVLVELDDRTHRPAKDAGRDAMTSSAGYRTIRIPSRPRPTMESVRAAVAPVCHSSVPGPLEIVRGPASGAAGPKLV